MSPSVPTWNAGRPRPKPACSNGNRDPQLPRRCAVANLPSNVERGRTRRVVPETPACDRLPPGGPTQLHTRTGGIALEDPKSPDGGRRSTDVLFSSPGAEPGESQPPPELSKLLAEFRQLREKFDVLAEELRQLRSAEERSEGDALGAELRSRFDEWSAQNKQSVEELLRRFAEVEVAVHELRDARRDEDIAHRLRVAETSLAGVSEAVRGLEGRLSERLEPIERAAISVEETTRGLRDTARKLDEAAEGYSRVLPTVEQTRKEVGRLETSLAIAFSVMSVWLAVLSLALEKRIQLFSELLGLW